MKKENRNPNHHRSPTSYNIVFYFGSSLVSSPVARLSLGLVHHQSISWGKEGPSSSGNRSNSMRTEHEPDETIKKCKKNIEFIMYFLFSYLKAQETEII